MAKKPKIGDIFAIINLGVSPEIAILLKIGDKYSSFQRKMSPEIEKKAKIGDISRKKEEKCHRK